jgi:hypothetical protein
MPKKLSILLGAVLLWSGVAIAADPLAEVVPTAAVKTLAEKGSHILEPHYFKGPGNLIGVAGKTSNGNGMVIFIDPAGQYVTAGAVVDVVNKVELSRAAALKWLAGTKLGTSAVELESEMPSAAPMEAPAWKGSAKAAMAELEKLAWIETGKGDGLIYAIVDPLCSHCKQAWKEVSAWQKKNRTVRVRWVPVSLGTPESADLASAAIGSGTTQGLDSAIRNEAEAGTDKTKERGRLLLKKNQAFIANFKDFSTPTFLVIHQDKISAVVGFSSISSILRPLGK